MGQHIPVVNKHTFVCSQIVSVSLLKRFTLRALTAAESFVNVTADMARDFVFGFRSMISMHSFMAAASSLSTAKTFVPQWTIKAVFPSMWPDARNSFAIKGGGRPTRLLPHAKMLLVPIGFFLCWVDYALEGSTFSLSKCDFSRMFHTERSWHTSIYSGYCFWSAGFALWCKRIFFDLFWNVKLFYYGWIGVPIFSKVLSGSDLSDFL